MEQVPQRHGMHPAVHEPPAVRDNTRRNGRQFQEPLRNDASSATAAMAATKQQWRGRTATHADVATAGKRDSHLPSAFNDYDCTAATAADAIPATSATATTVGKFWRCVPAGRRSTKWECMEALYLLLSREKSWAPTFDS